MSARDMLERWRADNLDITIEFRDGTIVDGRIAATMDKVFYVVDGTPLGEARVVAYSDIRSIAAQGTGERLVVQSSVPTRGMQGTRSLKRLMWFGLIAGAACSHHYHIRDWPQSGMTQSRTHLALEKDACWLSRYSPIPPTDLLGFCR